MGIENFDRRGAIDSSPLLSSGFLERAEHMNAGGVGEFDAAQVERRQSFDDSPPEPARRDVERARGRDDCGRLDAAAATLGQAATGIEFGWG